jgi:hypothetical protein
LDAAHAKRGSTVFDWLVEIFEEEVQADFCSVDWWWR